MDKFNPDAHCGIYCGACSIKMLGKTGCADKFAACLGSVPKEELSFCGGCRSDTVYAGCSICSLRHCAREKGVTHCIDCADYPCKMYSKWQSVSKFLPHAREAISNLEAIKRDGVDTWLSAQQKRWSCPKCGTPFSWYATECCKCGRRFASEAYKISGWKKLLCRFVLPMAYRKGKAKRTTT
jgi:hypothetical protein